VHVHKPAITAPPPPQPSTTIPSKPKVATKLTAAQSYATATNLHLPPPPPPPPVWKVHQSKQQKKQKQHEESPFAPAKNLPVEAHHIIFSRDPSIKASPKPDQEFMAAINNCLYLKNAPQFHRVAKVTRNAKGTITATTVPGVDATMLLHLYHNEILNAIREVDRGVTNVKELDKWVHLKVYGIPLNRFMGRGTQGVQKLQLEIQANHKGVEVLPGICWLGKAGSIKERYQRGDIQCSSAVSSVKGTPAAQLLMATGVLLGSTHYRMELYVYEGPDSQCSGCLKWGHIREWYPTPQIFCCNYCAESHPSVQHRYTLEGCSPPAGVPCEHF
jgi:hypothetical protein